MKVEIVYKYISNITADEFEKNVVVPCFDEEGFSSLLIKNSNENKTVCSSFKTNNLKWELNKILMKDGQPFNFHIIKMLKKDSYSVSQFNIIFDYIFSKIQNPISDFELQQLLSSIEDLFQVTPEKDLRLFQIGIFGELLTIRYLYENGILSIGDKYHNHFSSKHDIEINQNLRIEVKSSVNEKRIHRFSHSQISRTDISVIIASLILEEAKEGTSLKEMFDYVFDIVNNPDVRFNLQLLYKKCNLENTDGLRFALNKAKEDIRFISAKNAPKIPAVKFEGVSNISYDVDLSMAECYSLDEILTLLKQEI